ncbi:hypothetical protein MASR1M60_07680 [Rhodocyclaceae bacterium]
MKATTPKKSAGKKAESPVESASGEAGENIYMPLAYLIEQIHSAIEKHEGFRRITRSEMAQRLGLSDRTYVEYQRHTEPLAFKAALRLLAQLPDPEIVRFVREWQQYGRPPEPVTSATKTTGTEKKSGRPRTHKTFSAM